MKKLSATLVLCYLIVSGVFFAYIFSKAPVGGKIVISIVTFYQFKQLLFWSLLTLGIIGGIDILKEKYPNEFKDT